MISAHKLISTLAFLAVALKSIYVALEQEIIKPMELFNNVKELYEWMGPVLFIGCFSVCSTLIF